MLQLGAQLVEDLQENLVVFLHLVGRVHHVGAHDVRAVALVPDPDTANHRAEVQVVLVTTRIERTMLKGDVMCLTAVLDPEVQVLRNCHENKRECLQH